MRAIANALASIAGVLLLPVCFSLQGKFPGTIESPDESLTANAGFVGSKVCSKCHPSIYESFTRTDMGRSMSEITPALLERIPASGTIFDPKLNRHFDTFVRHGDLYQSEYETTADGKDVFRETQKLEWVIGSGANGSGAIVKQGEYLFEAPLSFYAKPPAVCRTRNRLRELPWSGPVTHSRCADGIFARLDCKSGETLALAGG